LSGSLQPLLGLDGTSENVNFTSIFSALEKVEQLVPGIWQRLSKAVGGKPLVAMFDIDSTLVGCESYIEFMRYSAGIQKYYNKEQHNPLFLKLLREHAPLAYKERVELYKKATEKPIDHLTEHELLDKLIDFEDPNQLVLYLVDHIGHGAIGSKDKPEQSNFVPVLHGYLAFAQSLAGEKRPYMFKRAKQFVNDPELGLKQRILADPEKKTFLDLFNKLIATKHFQPVFNTMLDSVLAQAITEDIFDQPHSKRSLRILSHDFATIEGRLDGNFVAQNFALNTTIAKIFNMINLGVPLFGAGDSSTTDVPWLRLTGFPLQVTQDPKKKWTTFNIVTMILKTLKSIP